MNDICKMCDFRFRCLTRDDNVSCVIPAMMCDFKYDRGWGNYEGSWIWTSRKGSNVFVCSYFFFVSMNRRGLGAQGALID